MFRVDMSQPDSQAIAAAELAGEQVEIFNSELPAAEPIRVEPFMVDAIVRGL